jgi:hypothetical protein
VISVYRASHTDHQRERVKCVKKSRSTEKLAEFPNAPALMIVLAVSAGEEDATIISIYSR